MSQRIASSTGKPKPSMSGGIHERIGAAVESEPGVCNTPLRPSLLEAWSSVSVIQLDSLKSQNKIATAHFTPAQGDSVPAPDFKLSSAFEPSRRERDRG